MTGVSRLGPANPFVFFDARVLLVSEISAAGEMCAARNMWQRPDFALTLQVLGARWQPKVAELGRLDRANRGSSPSAAGLTLMKLRHTSADRALEESSRQLPSRVLTRAVLKGVAQGARFHRWLSSKNRLDQSFSSSLEFLNRTSRRTTPWATLTRKPWSSRPLMRHCSCACVQSRVSQALDVRRSIGWLRRTSSHRQCAWQTEPWLGGEPT